MGGLERYFCIVITKNERLKDGLSHDESGISV